MRARRATRTMGAVALVVPMTVGLVATTAEPAAAASGSISSPGQAAVISEGTSVYAEASGTFNSGESAKLATVDGPEGTDLSQNASKVNCTSSLTNSCANRSFKLSYSVRVSPTRPNGKVTLQLTGSGMNTTRSFYTNFAPATPSGLSAQGKGASQVDLTWSYAGDEPDLRGFVVTDDKGNTFQVEDPSARSYTAYYSNPAPGTYDYSFTVKALRSSCGAPCGSPTVSGDSSGPAAAQLVTPQPPPSPTPEPTGSTGTTGGTTGGSAGTTGGTSGSTSGTTGSTSGTTGATSGSASGTTGAQAGTTGGKKKPVFSIPSLSPQASQRRAFALGFNRFSPSLGIPKLPPLPATTFPVTAPEDAGGYQPTLPYKPETEVTATDVFTDPVGVITSLDADGIWRGTAMAMIMMLIVAHIRIFLGKPSAV